MQTQILKIALVSPSSFFEQEELDRALVDSSDLGLTVINKSSARLGSPAFLNGHKSERLLELYSAETLGADALWCIRGGCGALELWHDYDAKYYASQKEPLIGYSDATILHFMRFYRAGRIGIHGPMFLDFREQMGAIRLLLEKKAQQISYPPLRKLIIFCQPILKALLSS